ncbi:MAG TPA: hypothetical protein VFC85_06580 [Verrucomicrobiae bacterium]|nr:hypothetical protein [Verrucomicrobiae bacterium]
MKSKIHLAIAGFIFGFGCFQNCLAEASFDAGPLFDQFPLTLESGQRTEVLGPLFYDQQKDSEKTWALPPFFSSDKDPAVESHEDDFLYPLLTYEYYGQEYRWQLFELISFAGGRDPNDGEEKRFTLFPFYFQQRSPAAANNYTALVPFYGHLQNRLFHDKIFLVLFPIYSQTTKRDVVTDNYLYPFFHLKYGNGLFGWQFWPVAGHEHKIVTTSTNGFGDVSIVPGHDKFFLLWPFYFKSVEGIGTDDPSKSWVLLPFYVQLRSPLRESTTVLWPFFSWINEREKKYHEWQGPWPFVIFARGDGKTTSRIWPLFSQSHNNILESDSYLWPVYRYHRIHSDPLDERRTRIMFYLFENTVEKNTGTGKDQRRVDMWPFFTWHRDFNGNTRLQILALLEPILPTNDRIERNWSPLWSIWRSEKNPRTDSRSQSLLWNLYRREATPVSKKCSLLFGLFQYQSDSETKKLRLFYLPVLHTHHPPK